MQKLIFKQGDIEDLDFVKPLWEKLNHLHLELSQHFKSRFQCKTWEQRKSDLILKSREIRVDYVTDGRDCIIGYCISTLDKENEKNGEIDSIYIDEDYRKTGIGKQLMNNAVDWLILKGTETQRLEVGAGNEQVLDFYKQFDFYPINIVLQRIEKNLDA